MNEVSAPAGTPTEDALRDRIAANVRAEVARRRIPIAQIIELLGFNRPSVSRRLNGHSPFYAHEIVMLAQLMDVPAASLLACDMRINDRVPRHQGPGVLGAENLPPA